MQYRHAFRSFWCSPVPWVVLAMSAIVVGCESLQTAALDLAQRNVANGTWTTEEATDFIAKASELRTTAETLWGQAFAIGGTLITSVLASYGIVMKKRGPTESQRVVNRVSGSGAPPPAIR